VELEAEKCPLCGVWIVDGKIDKRGGILHRFIYRIDLREVVCEKCDMELGPDRERLHAMSLSRNADRMMAKYMSKYIKGLLPKE